MDVLQQKKKYAPTPGGKERQNQQSSQIFPAVKNAISSQFFGGKGAFRNVTFDSHDGLTSRPPGANWWNTCIPASKLQMVDSISGAHMGNQENFVFRLIPRKLSIGVNHLIVTPEILKKAASKINFIVGCLEQIEAQSKQNGIVHGKKKICCLNVQLLPITEWVSSHIAMSLDWMKGLSQWNLTPWINLSLGNS